MSKGTMLLVGIFLCFATSFLANKDDMHNGFHYICLASVWLIAASFKKDEEDDDD